MSEVCLSSAVLCMCDVIVPMVMWGGGHGN